MKKMNVAAVATILVAIVYFAVIFIFGASMPKESRLYFVDPYWHIDLDFKVSYLWYALSSPLFLLTTFYIFSAKRIVGDRPRSNTNQIQYKYYTRFHVFVAEALALCFLSFTLIVFSIMGIIIPSSVIGGPLTTFVTGIIVSSSMYVIAGFILEFMYALLVWESSADEELHLVEENLHEKYEIMLSQFSKRGLVKTSPFIFGMTVGYTLRVIVIFIKKLLKRLAI